MKLSHATLALVLTVGSIAFAGGSKDRNTVKGYAQVESNGITAHFALEAKGELKKGVRRVQGEFEAALKDANGNPAQLEMNRLQSLTVNGKVATLTGTGYIEMPSSSFDDDDNDDSDDDTFDDNDVKVRGNFRITVADNGRGTAQTSKDSIVIEFDDPTTEGIDLVISNTISAGSLTIAKR
jgi:hypothetical protein